MRIPATLVLLILSLASILSGKASNIRPSFQDENADSPRFIGQDRTTTDRVAFSVSGSSPGWTGDVDSATFLARRGSFPSLRER